MSRPARPTRSSRAPRRHDFDARAFTRALYRGGRNHVGPANMLSCASRLQDPSPCHGTRPRAAFATKRQAKADSPATARRREPAVGQEAVSSRSRMRRPVRSQWLTQRHDRLNTACCLSAKGVAKTKQRFDRAVGPAVAPCAQMQPQHQRFFNELKSHPGGMLLE